MTAQPPPARILTFYSYKGGTGRSMALANVAWILASNGKRVLAIDWDVEAPGLHRYFTPFLPDPELRDTNGIIDFVVDYDLRLAEIAPEQGDAPPAGIEVPGLAADRGGVVAFEEEPWRAVVRRQARNIHLYATPLRAPFKNDGEIDFIPAGMQGPHYATRVNSYDWKGLYESRHGWELMEAVKEELREYDYVLIDSRTGVSDTSGICSVQFPDAVVVCFTLNNQGMHGAANIAADIAAKRSDVEIFPVPMRVEMAEKEKVEERKELARQRFAQFPLHALADLGRDRYWGEVPSPYVPFYAYEEVLAAFGDRPGDTNSLLGAMERLTAFVTAGEVKQLAPLSEPERVRILKLYTGRENAASDEGPTPEQRAARAEREMAALPAPEQEAALRVLARLVQPARAGEGLDSWVRIPLSACDGEERAVIRKLTPTLFAVKADEGSGADVVQIADPGLALWWDRLRHWVEENRAFFLWRRRLAASMAEWEDSERDRSSLLTGARLKAARGWIEQRGDRLGLPEIDFIEASRREQRRKRLTQINTAGTLLVALFAAGIQYYTALQNGRRTEQARAQLESEFRDSLSASRARALVDSGYTHRMFGEYAAALSAYDSALKLQPANADAYSGRGMTRVQQGEIREGITDLTRAVTIDSANARTYADRAGAYLLRGDTLAAVADLRKVTEIGRDSAMVVWARSRLSELTRATGGVPVDTTVRIYIQYKVRGDLATAQAVAQRLGIAGYKVMGAEFKPNELSTGNVRYFHAADSAQARLIQQIVGGVIRASRITVSNLDRPQYARVPSGQIEVWIPALSAGTRTDSARVQPREAIGRVPKS